MQYSIRTFSGRVGVLLRLAQHNPPVLDTPNLAVGDGLKYSGNGKIAWKPVDIKAPVWMIQGEWNQDTLA